MFRNMVVCLALILPAGSLVVNVARGNDVKPVWHPGLAFHGRFCGLGHPWIDPLNPDAEQKVIEKLQPLDLIDAACKQHDLCYIESGFFSRTCDQKVATRLRQLAKEFTSQPGTNPLCVKLARIAADYFDDGPQYGSTLDEVQVWFEDASELPISLSMVSTELVEVLMGLAPQKLRCGSFANY